MTTLGYFGAVIAVWVFILVAGAVIAFHRFDSREQRRTRDHRVLLAHDWPTPDFEETPR